jgi:hypothetical protein
VSEVNKFSNMNEILRRFAAQNDMWREVNFFVNFKTLPFKKISEMM